VTVSTDALSPEFTWFLNGTELFGEESDFLEVNLAGNYAVRLSQTADCIAYLELNFTVVEAFPDVGEIPNMISPNNDGINDTWVIPQEYTSGSNTEIEILSSTGELVFKTTDYQNNWPLEPIDFTNINPLYYYIISPPNQSSVKGTITVVK